MDSQDQGGPWRPKHGSPLGPMAPNQLSHKIAYSHVYTMQTKVRSLVQINPKMVLNGRQPPPNRSKVRGIASGCGAFWQGGVSFCVWRPQGAKKYIWVVRKTNKSSRKWVLFFVSGPTVVTSGGVYISVAFSDILENFFWFDRCF